PTNGIVWTNTTQATGSFTITGNGGTCGSAATCTGGAILNTGGDAISLDHATNVSFTRLFIQNSVGMGIKSATNGHVQNFTFANGFINNSGTGLAVDASNIAFNSVPSANETNLTGTVSITNSTFTNAFYHGVDIQEFGGTITTLTITGNTFTSSTSGSSSLGSAIRIGVRGTAANCGGISGATISNNTITNFPSGAGVLIQGGNGTGATAPACPLGTAATPIDVTSNVISGASSANLMGTQAINVAIDGVGNARFNVTNNGTVGQPLANTAGVAI